MYFLRQLRKDVLPQELLIQFYSAIIQSVLCLSITVWLGSDTKRDRNRLQQTIRTAERITGANLPSNQDLTNTSSTVRKQLFTPHQTTSENTVKIQLCRLIVLSCGQLMQEAGLLLIRGLFIVDYFSHSEQRCTSRTSTSTQHSYTSPSHTLAHTVFLFYLCLLS